jgi:hypothetical protein
MDEPSLTDCEECLAPEEAFGVLANETRLSILEALWAADEPVVSFSALRRATGVSDSAQFNYHLGELRGEFVRKREDGYELTYAGRAVIQAVVAGTFNERPEVEPFAVEGDCVDCGGPLCARYEDDQFWIECADCGQCHVRYPFPPGGLADRSRTEAVRALDQRVRHFHCLMGDGVCPHCGGTVASTLVVDGSFPAFLDIDVAVSYTCNRCPHELTTPVGMVVLDHVEVVSFYRDHGVDLNERPMWTLPWIRSADYVTVESRDPCLVTLTVPLEDERLRLRLDGDLNVREAERLGGVAAAEESTSAAGD